MPQYCYKCQDCGRKVTEFRTIADRNIMPLVACNPPPRPGIYCHMVRDLRAEVCSVRGDYEVAIVSDSMAFDGRADDLAEHRRRFPNIDVVVDGRMARPVFRSLSQRRNYLKDRRWVDTNSYF